jgi:hypothetical protein
MDSLNKLTKAQLTKLCQELDDSVKVKISSSLLKNDLIQLYYGLLQMKQQQIPHSVYDKTLDLKPVSVYQQLDVGNCTWRDHLLNHGWAVVDIPEFNAEVYKDMFLNWLNSICPSFKTDDMKTWTKQNMPLAAYGIFRHYIGHTDFVWQIREKCIPIFEQIWEVESTDLLCSFDGGCLLTDSNCNTKIKNWLHVDQGRNMLDFVCVQGLVNLVDNGGDDGGLVVVEGSHRYFKEYFDRHPIDGMANNWNIEQMDPQVASSKKLKICAAAGQITLWDSRLFHYNVPPTKKNSYRLCTYVSMAPRIGSTEKELAKRIKLYESGRMSNHWCYGPIFKETPAHPHTYGSPSIQPATVEIAVLNDTQKKMVGY